jgi:hypothetical protein
LLAAAKSLLDASGVCEPASLLPSPTHATMLSANAKGSASPAMYRLMWDAGKLWVALQTSERYLSQSIEADLVHTGDKLNELIDEELVELGITRGIGVVEHFRSQDKLYTFRSVVPVDLSSTNAAPSHATSVASLASIYVRAYEAAFRNLGDMEADDEE